MVHDARDAPVAQAWFPVIGLTAVAYAGTRTWQPVGVMLALAVGQFFGFKAWTIVADRCGIAHPARLCGYVLGWPGLDPLPFRTTRRVPGRALWSLAVPFALGMSLTWGVTRHLVAQAPLIAGWCGFFGLILVVHFGLFGVLANTWRRAGVPVHYIMNIPPWPHSVTAWWSRGWNHAFRDLAHRAVFVPLARRYGASRAVVGVFVFSGAAHELVISVPVGSGFGGPLAYFLIQAVAVLLERSMIGARLGMMRGGRGVVFTLCTVVLPMPLLFHRPFVDQVVLPMLQAIGAW